MENKEEQFRQVDELITILKDAGALCQGGATAGLVASALEGAQTLQQLIVEGEGPGSPEERRFEGAGLPRFSAEAFPAGDAAELCFPV